MVATIPCATWNRRGRYKNYSESDVMHGLQMMVSGQSVKKASDASGVPQSTLTDRMNRLNLRKKSDVDLQLLKKLQSSQQPEEGDRQSALHLVHKGASLRKAEAETGVPKTTLIRMTRACKAHPGPCQGADIRALIQLDFDSLNSNSDGTGHRQKALPMIVGSLIRPYKMYSEEDRKRALDMVHEGASLKQAEAATGVPKTTVMRLTKSCSAHSGICFSAKTRPGTEWKMLPFILWLIGTVKNQCYRQNFPPNAVYEQFFRPCKMYSEEDRRRALDMIHEGATFRVAALATGVPRSTVLRLTKACTEHSGICQNAKKRPDTLWYNFFTYT
ncbi:hypothetical protein ACOMHN_007472 [Nucella lapillus]